MNRKSLILLLFISVVTISYSQNVGIGNSSPQSKLDVNGDLALREGSAITVSAGSNSITLPSPANSVYRLTGAGGAFTISSISAGHNGSVLTLINATGQVMTIANGSTILTNTGANLVASGSASTVSLIYNATLTQWVVTSDEGFSAGGGSGTVTNVTASSPVSITGTSTVTPNVLLSGTAGGVLYGVGSGTGSAFNSAGTSGQYLQSAGSGAPVWKTPVGKIHHTFSMFIYPTSSTTYYTANPSAVGFSDYEGIIVGSAYYPHVITTTPASVTSSFAAEGATYIATGSETVNQINGWIWQATTIGATTVNVYAYKYSPVSGATYTTAVSGTLIGNQTVSLANTGNGIYSFSISSGTVTMNAGDVVIVYIQTSNTSKQYYVNGTVETLANTQ